MKRFIAMMLLAFALIGVYQSNAQKHIVMPMYLGGEVGINVPMGDFGDAANLGFGGDAFFNYYFTPQVLLNASFGFFTWGSDVEGVTFTNLPLMAGVLYEFNAKGFTPYVGAEIGLNFFSGKYSSGFGQTFSSSKTKFGFAPTFGIVAPMSPDMDFRANLKFNVVEDANSFCICAGLRWKLQ